MLENILDLKGVKKLSKENLVSIYAAGNCRCGKPGGGQELFRGVDFDGFPNVNSCWEFCDAWRAENF